MSTKEELMGLGIPHFQAQRLGNTPIAVTVAGATMGDARVCGLGEYDLQVHTSNGSGTGLVLKSPASTDGYSLGDQISLVNLLSTSIVLYIRNAKVVFSGISVSGTGGVSVGTGQVCFIRPISASTWSILGSVLSAA